MTKKLWIAFCVSCFLFFVGSVVCADQLPNLEQIEAYDISGGAVPPVNAETSESAFPCIYIADDLSMNIPCASYKGGKYGFTLDYYLNPADPGGLYWKMDLNSFVVIPSSCQLIAGAFYNATDGSYILASPEKYGVIQEDAVITVNGTPLAYGLPITYEGQELTKIPIYYSDMNFNPGDSLTISAKLSGEVTPFFQDTVIVPSELAMTKPSEAQFVENQAIDVAWNETSDTMLYSLSFYDPLEWDNRPYDTTTLVNIAKIPAAYVVSGDFSLEVYAFNGKNIDKIFIDENVILGQSFWMASTYDYKDLKIDAENQAGDMDVNVSLPNDEGRVTVPLKLLKADRVTIKGIRFTRRIYDAQQIASPGKAQISVKLEKNHLAIAAINVLDSTEKEYFAWSHTRKYKSHSKTYHHSINLVPYSTVIIHTKSSDLLTANYSY